MEVKIRWTGDEKVVKLRKITWGEYAEVLRGSMSKLKMIGSTPSAELDYVSFIELLTLRSIEYAPFEVNLENLRKLEPEDFLKLSTEAQKLNPLPL